jgi:serine/threonine protein kinase
MSERMEENRDIGRVKQEAMVTPMVEAVKAEVRVWTSATTAKLLESLREMSERMEENRDIGLIRQELADMQRNLQDMSSIKNESVMDVGVSALSEDVCDRARSDTGGSLEVCTRTIRLPTEEEDGIEPVEQIQPGALLSRTLELQNLRTDLNEARRQTQRLENQLEHRLDDYDKFLEDLGRSSSKPVLTEAFDFSLATVLSRGHYGYVFACKSRSLPHSQVVVKVMSERWARVVASEWAHGNQIGKHPHIVEHLQVLVHDDAKGEVRRCIQAAFASSSLPGQAPESFPARYYAIVLELMEHGTAWQLAKEGLLNVVGCGAIARQVASALAFLHRRKRTHNDVKPENILLQRARDGGHLVVKLADMGLVAHSVERGRDFDLFAYSLWCLILRRRFTQCPAGKAREAALAKLGNAASVQRARSLGVALVHMVGGIWQGTTGFCEVETLQEFQGLEVALPPEEAAAS